MMVSMFYGRILVQDGGGQPEVDSRFPLVAIRDHFSSKSMIPVEWIIVGAGLVFLIVAGLAIYHLWTHRHERSAPLLVFNRVAVGQSLTLTDRWFLWRIATQQALPTPLTLLLSPQTLVYHGRAFATSRAPWRRAAILRHVAAIRRVLADGPSLGELSTPS